MKKVVVLLLSAVLVLSMAAAAFGVVNVSGELKAKYKFQGENSVGGESPETTDTEKNDEVEAKIILDSQINEKLSAKLVAKLTANANDGGDKFGYDEYWAAYKDTFGQVKVGYFGYKTKGNVDVLDGAYKDLKSVTGVEYSNKLAETIDVAVFYNPDYNKKDEELFDNAFAVKAGINQDFWGVEVNYVNVGDGENTDNKAGYTVNARITPIENLNAYVSYGVDQYEDVVSIIGADYTMGNLTARVEYDLNENIGKDSDKDKMESNLYGVKLIYKAPHGVEYEFGKKLTATAKGMDQESECWVSAKIAFN
jgi:hypothetical protein